MMEKKIKFEAALKKLEEIVEKLESGETELEESLKLFEEGIELINYCNQKLNETKKKIEMLIEKSGKYSPVEIESEREISGSITLKEETEDENKEELF